MSKKIKIAIFGDTHIRLLNEKSSFPFKSDFKHNDRAKKAVEIINTQNVDFTIHMGDVVHPIPVDEKHIPALDEAKSIFQKLNNPLYVVPGNHDIGDKKNTKNAPAFSEKSRAVFEKYWNKSYFNFNHEGINFIILDAVALTFDNDASREQLEFFESCLNENKQNRSFLFLHFPPFLLHIEEEEHYDNLPITQRLQLLALIEKYSVEAIFSGHVHRFFYNKIADTNLYTLPSTSFVRPEYANLRLVKPTDNENALQF